MRIVAVNSSPMMGKGNTALILDPFLEGLREAGAKVWLHYTKKLDIRPCQGDFHCWVRHPGECFQDDDMKDLLPQFRDAEVWVFASPVYVDGLSGPMKNLLDRMIPLIQPAIEMQENHCRHPRREGTKAGQVVLVSTCGFWEMDNFDPLLAHMDAICKNVGRTFAGALLRPHGPALKLMSDLHLPTFDVVEAAKRAGRELVERGGMGPETLRAVSRDLVPRDLYVEALNRRFDESIRKWEARRRRES